MTRTEYSDTDWALLIADMMSVQGQPNVTISITGNEVALQGMTERGEEFVTAISTDEAGVTAMRGVAGLLGFPVREFQHYPAQVDGVEEGF